MATLVMERIVPADPAAVFAAWTDTDLLRRWWWPMLPDTSYVLDARVGGFYRMASESADFGVHGKFLDLKPPRLIVMSWCWEEGAARGPIETVTVAFDAVDDATRVTMTHPCEDSENLELGWNHVLDRLVGFADQLR